MIHFIGNACKNIHFKPCVGRNYINSLLNLYFYEKFYTLDSNKIAS